MLATMHPISDSVPARAVGRRVRARVRPLLRRASQRRADRGVLDRLRAGAVRPQRPPRHALEVQRDPARRLCQDAGRRRCRQRQRSTRATRTEPDSFPAKSVWQRMAIVVAGPMSNFLFAIVALAILFAAVGRPFTPAEVGAVQPDSPAAAAGLRAGRPDHRGRRAADRQLRGAAGDGARQCRPGRSPSRSPATARCRSRSTPAASEIEDRFGNKQQVGLIGVSRAGVEYRRSNPFLALFEATARNRPDDRRHAVGAWARWWPARAARRSWAGRCGSPRCRAQIAQDGFVPALWFTAVLSINLGLINLFPIPMLDGGHLAMYGIEAARGRPLNERARRSPFASGSPWC